MSLEKLREIKLKVEKELEDFFDGKIKNSDSHIFKEALEFLKDYTLRGGKRLRVGFLVYGYGCFKEINGEIIKAGMVMELIQSYLLIHDDIIDKDVLRRGKGTMHAMYEKKYDIDDKKHFGISMAICAGDLAATLANEVLLDTNFEDKVKVVKVMNKILEKVVDGQMLDIVYEKKSPDKLNEEDILNMYRLKTGTYTVEGPLHMGGLLAGVNEEKLKPLLDYGIVLGKAFQIRDDINGIFGDKSKTGKSDDSDLKKGKRTLLIIKTLENCGIKDRNFVLRCLANEDITKEDIEKVKKIIKKSGALDYCLKLIDKFVNEAINSIKDLKLRNEGKEFLLGVTDFIAKRDY